MKESEAQPFLAPVPTGVLEYHRAVLHPMDLGTVLARLKSGWYTPGATALHAKLLAGEVRFLSCHVVSADVVSNRMERT